MSEQATSWPEKFTPKTQAEWDEVVKDWGTPATRDNALQLLKALKVPAMKYARLSDPKDRVALIIVEQGRLVPGSLEGSEKKAAPAKTAAPKATTSGTATTGGGAAGGAAANAQVIAKLDAILASVQTSEAILKLLLLQNPDALQLAADEDTLNEIASKSLTELAQAGNS